MHFWLRRGHFSAQFGSQEGSFSWEAGGRFVCFGSQEGTLACFFGSKEGTLAHVLAPKRALLCAFWLPGGHFSMFFNNCPTSTPLVYITDVTYLRVANTWTLPSIVHIKFCYIKKIIIIKSIMLHQQQRGGRLTKIFTCAHHMCLSYGLSFHHTAVIGWLTLLKACFDVFWKYAYWWRVTWEDRYNSLVSLQ